MINEDNISTIPASERDDFYSDDSLYSIRSWGADLPFRELITQYEEGDLVKPQIQRNYVWDKAEACRFIESILLGLPIPSIFLAKTTDEKLLIVDGYQRIMTVYDYVKGIFSKDGKVFQLTNSKKINERWRGKTFQELSYHEQRTIKLTTIHCIIFMQLSPKNGDTSLYQIFERINTSGRTLMPQEIRNCVYQGAFNDLLIELNNEPSWRTLYGLEKPDTRMRDMEFILRFLALGSEKFQQETVKRVSLKKFLNEFMGDDKSQTSQVIANRKDKFKRTIRFLEKNIGSSVFHNVSPKNPEKLGRKFNPTIYDSIMLATEFALRQPEKITVKKDDLLQRKLKLLQNDEYQELIRVQTTNIDRINKRIKLATDYLYGMSYE